MKSETYAMQKSSINFFEEYLCSALVLLSLSIDFQSKKHIDDHC